MPRIDRYILGQLLAYFGFFALVLVSVYWLNRAVMLFEQLIGDGQTALVVLEFTLLTLPLAIALVLPVAAFAASAYGTHRLAGESELAVLQGAGLSPWRLARPVLAFGLAVGLMVAALVNGLVPAARARLAERQADIAQNVAAQFLRPGAFQAPLPGLTLFVRAIDAEGTIRDLLLEDDRDPARPMLYTAERARLHRTATGSQLTMEEGLAQQTIPGTPPRLAVTRFAQLTTDLGRGLGAGAGTDLRQFGTLALLRADTALLSATGAGTAEARLAAHQRLAQPLMAPVAAMLGFAMLTLGGFSRFGAGRQVLGAVLALVALQFMTTAADSRAGADPAHAWPAVYLPALAGAAACAAILWQAARPRRAVPA